MADITKAVDARTVTFTATTPRADPWMKQRFGSHTITFNHGVPHERERAIALEAAARALELTIELR
jgi:hypothetical protein